MEAHDAQLQKWYCANAAALEDAADEKERRYEEVFAQARGALRLSDAGGGAPWGGEVPSSPARLRSRGRPNARVNRHGSITIGFERRVERVQ